MGIPFRWLWLRDHGAARLRDHGAARSACPTTPPVSRRRERSCRRSRSASTGVVGMLEVILSDFERLEADTKESEAMNQKEFEKFMHGSNQAKAVLEASVKNKNELKTETDVNLATAQKDLASTQEELNAALAYFEKLKPSCVEAGVSYEDRVARRKEEIESLQEALEILNGKDIA